MFVKLLLVMVPVVASVVGCASESHPHPLLPPVPVQGILQMVGGPVGSPTVRVPGRVTFAFNKGATMSVPVKADGTFALELNPGDYDVTGTSPKFGDSKGVCRADAVVVVKAGMQPVVVSCQRR